MSGVVPVNVCVFEYEQSGSILTAIGSSTSSKDEAILVALEGLDDIKNLTPIPIKVLRIYSEWEPSIEIYSVLWNRFPNIEITYSFKDGDEDAFEAEMEKIHQSKSSKNESQFSPKQEENNSKPLSNPPQEQKRWWKFW
ncbi:hypothetical protein [Emticicia fontis]